MMIHRGQKVSARNSHKTIEHPSLNLLIEDTSVNYPLLDTLPPKGIF
jgi:hypothetical protein